MYMTLYSNARRPEKAEATGAPNTPPKTQQARADDGHEDRADRYRKGMRSSQYM